jgi:hypothetical protein
LLSEDGFSGPPFTSEGGTKSGKSFGSAAALRCTAPAGVCFSGQAVHSEAAFDECQSRAMVRIEGAWYSVPSRWARLDAIAYIGVDDVRITCLGESVAHPRVRFGTRQVRYRHYLPEPARKPHAVRQVAPELIAELARR